MIKKANIQWSGKALYNQMSKGNVLFDCAVQRGYVWDNERNSLLIHSMIEGYPIPAFYFSKREDDKYDALDGKQRSNAIFGYINGEYCLCKDFEPCVDSNGTEYDFSEKWFNDLPEWAQDAIKEYSLTIYYFEGLTEDERDSMFYRLNNGKPLTSIELTRVKAKSLEKFQDMAKHEVINLAVTDKGKVKYNHENLVMQAWATCNVEDVSFDTKAFRPLIEAAEVTEEQIEIISKCFDMVLSVYNSYNLEDKKEKRLAKRIVTRTHLVSLTKAAMVAIEEEYDINRFNVWAKKFFSGTSKASIDDDYNESCGAGSSRKEKINTRMETILNHMKSNI